MSRDGRTFADPPGGGGMRRPLAVRLALAVAVVILREQTARLLSRRQISTCSWSGTCKMHVGTQGTARRLCALTALALWTGCSRLPIGMWRPHRALIGSVPHAPACMDSTCMRGP